MEQIYKAEMIRVLDALFDAGSFNDRAVLLFGHCNATEEMADLLLARYIVPCAILDNSTFKQGLMYRGIPTVFPGHIQGYNADNSMVLISTRYFAEMAQQLKRLGYDGEIVRVVEYNSFVEYSTSDEVIERKTARMERGTKTLSQIRTQYPAHHLVICPNNALGDVYWAMAFLPAYREKHRIGKTAVAVIGEGCRQVAQMFGAKNITVLNNTEMDELVQAVIFTGAQDSIIAHHDRPYTDNIIKYLDGRFLSFIDFYRYAVYGLVKDTLPTVPVNLAHFENKEQIPKGKTVILSPYAKSVVEPPSCFWEEIAYKYAQKGYYVCTNTAGDEQPVSGTKSIYIPLRQMISATEYAGFFIGIRSGLCDVLNTANCHKTVVFPDCYYSTTRHKIEDFFALSGWEEIVIGGGFF
jgi:hypothetical protein